MSGSLGPLAWREFEFVGESSKKGVVGRSGVVIRGERRRISGRDGVMVAE
jgi:hypothetical protein